MHDLLIALCQEYTTDFIYSHDSANWGVALRIKRKYYQDFSSRIARMGYKVNNMAKEVGRYYFLHIIPDPDRGTEKVEITHRITSDLVLDLYEKALELNGSEKEKLMEKVKLLSQYVGGYMVK